MDERHTSGSKESSMITRDKIDTASDGELAALAELSTGRPCPLDGNGVLVLMDFAGATGAEMTLVCRSGIGLESVATLAARPGWEARVTVRHARPAVAVFRAFLYAVHRIDLAKFPTEAKATCLR